MSAEASFPKIEEKSPAFAVKGAKKTPKKTTENREKARIALSILN